MGLHLKKYSRYNPGYRWYRSIQSKKVRSISMKTYKYINDLPIGRADSTITEGCLVLEGGGWRGLYTVGVLDALMEHGINMRTTVGISAGALSGLGYVAGQIGWGARVDLTYRHDSKYCGVRSLMRERAIMGYDYFSHRIARHDIPLDTKTLAETSRRLVAGATNMLNGRITYFEKGKNNIWKAIMASASVPYVSTPVLIGGVPYLDGGCSEKIPYSFAKKSGEKKIIVVRTREREYRRVEGKKARTARVMYKKYPKFVKSIEDTNRKFNVMVDELERKETAGNLLIIAPSEKVTVTRFEGDMDKLGELYWLGYNDANDSIEKIKRYLES